MSIAILPDLCILVILDNLSMLDFVNIDLVSHRFATLQPVASLKRRSLTLEVNGGVTEDRAGSRTKNLPIQDRAVFNDALKDPMQNCEHVKLTLTKLTADVVKMIIAKLPHLKRLSFVPFHFNQYLTNPIFLCILLQSCGDFGSSSNQSSAIRCLADLGLSISAYHFATVHQPHHTVCSSLPLYGST